MRISDNVARYILALLEQENGTAEIQRNELANILGCVPSQINYVITSRFTPEHGYTVESRRGGGGYIRIIRRQMSKSDLVMHIINSIGNSINLATVKAMTDNLMQNQVIAQAEARMIQAALSERAMVDIPKEQRDQTRASIFKSMLLVTEV